MRPPKPRQGACRDGSYLPARGKPARCHREKENKPVTTTRGKKINWKAENTSPSCKNKGTAMTKHITKEQHEKGTKENTEPDQAVPSRGQQPEGQSHHAPCPQPLQDEPTQVPCPQPPPKASSPSTLCQRQQVKEGLRDKVQGSGKKKHCFESDLDRCHRNPFSPTILDQGGVLEEHLCHPP